METFEVKVTENRNETFASWRDGTHDDILLALALLLWYGERNSFNPPFQHNTGNRTPYDGLPPGTFQGGTGW
jgi:hypothetical protein